MLTFNNHRYNSFNPFIQYVINTDMEDGNFSNEDDLHIEALTGCVSEISLPEHSMVELFSNTSAGDISENIIKIQHDELPMRSKIEPEEKCLTHIMNVADFNQFLIETL